MALSFVTTVALFKVQVSPVRRTANVRWYVLLGFPGGAKRPVAISAYDAGALRAYGGVKVWPSRRAQKAMRDSKKAAL